MTLTSRQQVVLHWLPPGGVSLLLNLLLLHALGVALLPRGLTALDSVLSVELEPASTTQEQRQDAVRPHARPVAETPVLQPAPATAPNPPDIAKTEERDAQSDDESPTIEPLYRVTRLPAFLRRARPDYPESERALGRQARVLAEVTLNRSGAIVDARIIQSGGTAFDAAVIAALHESRFSPALIQDRAVSVRFRVPFQFKLE